MHLSPSAYLLLAATGLVAGLVDSIAGGGGLVALPMLLNLGFPAPLALGTNKLQSCVGTFTSSRHYVRSGIVDLNACRLGVAITFLGSLLGAWTVEHLDSGLLARVIPWLLAAIFLFTLFRPKVGRHDAPPRMGRTAFFVAAGLCLGFYDGFFGPGVGSLWAIGLVLALGQNFMKATGYTKVMNVTSNTAAIILFAAGGRIDYTAGLVMAAGQVCGARLGAGLVVKNGARFVRPIFLVVVAVTVARLIYVAARR